MPRKRHADAIDGAEETSDALEPATKRLCEPPSAPTLDLSDDELSADDAGPSTAPIVRNLASRAESGYPVGAIMRVKLTNFVTYDFVEFHPGPNLNVVIGPNGTGKSTVVCAICLGLNGATSLLGRQKDVGEFVKHGCAQAIIELDLCTDTGHSTVKRTITRAHNKSEWSIDGHMATVKQIKKHISSLGIQLENKCQFLPQDMVVQFARMSPEELLEATMKAVGGDEMVETHKSLIQLYKEDQGDSVNLEDLERERARKSHRQTELKQQVAIHEKRFKLTRQKESFRKLLGWTRFEEYRLEYVAAKEERDRLVAELSAKEQTLNPIGEQIKQAKRERGVTQDALAEVQRKYKSASDKVDKFLGRAQDLEEEVETTQTTLKSDQKQVKKSQQKLTTLEGQTIELTAAVTQLEESLKAEESESKLRLAGIMQDLRRLRDAIDTSLGQEREMSAEMKSTFHEVREIKMELKKLEDVRQKRLEFLQQRGYRDNLARDTLEVIHWLRSNQHELRGVVHEPILTLLHVKNPAHAKPIEQLIAGKDFMAFMCEEVADQDYLVGKFVKGKGKRINVHCAPRQFNMLPKRPIDAFPSEWGFTHYAIDAIDAPEPVKRWLCLNGGLHEVPIGTHNVNVNLNNIINSGMLSGRFLSNDTLYFTRKSNYGSKSDFTNTQPLKNPQILHLSVDMTYVETQRAKQSVLEHELEEMDERLKVVKANEMRMRNDYNTADQERQDLIKKKKELSAARNKLGVHQRSIEQERQRLKGLKGKMQQSLVQVRKLSDRRVTGVLKVKEPLLEAVALQQQLMRLLVVDTALLAKLRELESEQKQEESTLTDLRGAVELARRSLKEIKEKARLQQKKANGLCSIEAVPKLQDSLKPYIPDVHCSSDELEAHINSVQARIDNLAPVNSAHLGEYKKVCEEVDDLDRKMETVRHDRLERQNRMELLRDRWLPHLVTTVQAINKAFAANFGRLGCDGEVELVRDADYAKYRIVIKVKFTAREALQPLTATFQSGGERAVSTISYLMALQDLTPCPFRVVDEVNQGMDAEYERQMFNTIVGAACKKDTPQYFMITPKLLPALEYTPAMSILCVFNGPHLTPNAIDLRRYV